MGREYISAYISCQAWLTIGASSAPHAAVPTRIRYPIPAVRQCLKGVANRPPDGPSCDSSFVDFVTLLSGEFVVLTMKPSVRVRLAAGDHIGARHSGLPLPLHGAIANPPPTILATQGAHVHSSRIAKSVDFTHTTFQPLNQAGFDPGGNICVE